MIYTYVVIQFWELLGYIILLILIYLSKVRFSHGNFNMHMWVVWPKLSRFEFYLAAANNRIVNMYQMSIFLTLTWSVTLSVTRGQHSKASFDEFCRAIKCRSNMENLTNSSGDKTKDPIISCVIGNAPVMWGLNRLLGGTAECKLCILNNIPLGASQFS